MRIRSTWLCLTILLLSLLASAYDCERSCVVYSSADLDAAVARDDSCRIDIRGWDATTIDISFSIPRAVTIGPFSEQQVGLDVIRVENAGTLRIDGAVGVDEISTSDVRSLQVLGGPARTITWRGRRDSLDYSVAYPVSISLFGLSQLSEIIEIDSDIEMVALTLVEMNWDLLEVPIAGPLSTGPLTLDALDASLSNLQSFGLSHSEIIFENVYEPVLPFYLRWLDDNNFPNPVLVRQWDTDSYATVYPLSVDAGPL